MNREIPGYYFDPEKKRYFKIEASRTAPRDAAWSAHNVKRRKIESREEEQARQRAERERCRIRRARALTDPLTGGFLIRELGLVLPEVPTSAFVRGLRDKGERSLSSLQPHSNLPLLYVGSHDDKYGFGVAYGSPDESSIYGCYLSRDANDRLIEPEIKGRRFGGCFLRDGAMMYPQMSSIKYHKPSHKMLVTSRAPGPTAGIWYFSPRLSDDKDEMPSWVLEPPDVFQHSTIQAPSRRCEAFTCTPAPDASSLTCVIGTSDGILQFHRNGALTWTGHVSSSRSRSNTHRGGDKALRDVFSLDFLRGHPNVVLAGRRTRSIAMLDLRVAPLQNCERIVHRSSATHVRSVGEHQVLASGPLHSMALYDVRYRRQVGRNGGGRGGAAADRPLVTFPAFRNEARLDCGLDIVETPSPLFSGAVVAAAHDDGCVALYSLRSGRRLACPAVDAVAADGVVRSVVFQTLPHDVNPSLFLGIGQSIKKYSFGVLQEEGGGEALEE